MIGGSGANVRIGKINLLAPGLAQRYTALVGDHTDDVDPYGFGCLNADKNALADGRLTWKGVIGQDFINNDIGATWLVVLVVVCAALDQRCAHGFEVAGKHD